jgi:hypothetical protein
MVWKFKARSIIPGEYRLASGVLDNLISTADVRNAVDRGDGSLGSLVVPGGASGQVTLERNNTELYSPGQGFYCAKLTPLSTSQYGYWDFYIPAVASTAFRLHFYIKVSDYAFNGSVNLSVWDAMGSETLLLDNALLALSDLYVHTNIPITAPSTTGLCRVQFKFLNGTIPGIIYVDNIYVV